MVTLRSSWILSWILSWKLLIRDGAVCAIGAFCALYTFVTIVTIVTFVTIVTLCTSATLRAAESVNDIKSSSATHTSDTAQTSGTNQTSDTAQASDSSQTTAPLTPLFTVPMEHGSIPTDSASVWMTICKRDIQMRYYTGYGDLFELLVPVFPLSLGYHGQPHGVRAFGGSMRDNALLFNGRPMNDLRTGAMNMGLYSPEDMERVQILAGSAAVILADQSSGLAINIQEPLHNTKGPYSRLWYADGANNYYASDGILSQNVAPNLNVTFGFKREAGDGRFDNQWVDVWNVRGRIRWMPSANTVVSLTENFTNHASGSNGGVNTATSTDINDDVTATVLLPNANDRTLRHDLTLSVTSAADSTMQSVLRASAYYSHASSEISRSADMIISPDSALDQRSTAVRTGLNGSWQQRLLGGVATTIGANLEYTGNGQTEYAESLDQLRASAFGYCAFTLQPGTEIRGGARVHYAGLHTVLSAGVSARAWLSERVNAMLDVSRSARAATAAEGTGLSPEESLLALARVEWSSEGQRIDIGAFARRSANVLVSSVRYDTSGSMPIGSTAYSVPLQQSIGGHIQSTFALMKDVWLDASVQFAMVTRGDSSVKVLPSVYSMFGLRYTKTNGTSILTAGISARWRSAFSGETFIPMNWITPDATTGQAAAIGGPDLFAGAKLGNAWIKLRFQNVLSNSFTTVSTFPFPVRNFSLSVAWSFFD